MRRAPAAVWRRSGPQPHGLIFSKDPSLPQCFLAQHSCPSGTDAVDHQHSNPGDEPQGHQAGKNVDTLHSYLLVLRTFGFAGDALAGGSTIQTMLSPLHGRWILSRSPLRGLMYSFASGPAPSTMAYRRKASLTASVLLSPVPGVIKFNAHSPRLDKLRVNLRRFT